MLKRAADPANPAEHPRLSFDLPNQHVTRQWRRHQQRGQRTGHRPFADSNIQSLLGLLEPRDVLVLLLRITLTTLSVAQKTKHGLDEWLQAQNGGGGKETG